MTVGIAIFIGCFYVLLSCLAFRRSAKTKNNVVRLIPKSEPPRAVIEAGGQVIEFPMHRTKRGDK